MNSPELGVMYENVSEIVTQMVLAAEKSDWVQLARLEEQCSVQVESLNLMDTSVALEKEARENKINIIKKILSNDRKIRDITEPKIAQLGRLINNTGNQNSVSSAYQLDHRTF